MAAARPRLSLRYRAPCCGLLAALAPLQTQAHGFGQRYDLPLPLWLWVTGAGSVVALSFLALSHLIRRTPERLDYPRYDLFRSRVGRLLAHRAIVETLRMAAVGLFLLTLIAALFGNQDPFRNLAPTLVWVLWWVGLAFVCALVGNLWMLLNPLDTLFRWAELAVARVRPHCRLSLELPYPERLGAWPAVVAFVGFAWMELVWIGSEIPRYLGLAIAGYALYTWIGMLAFGRAIWLDQAETFSLAFGILSRFAPLEIRISDRATRHSCPIPACPGRRTACVDGYACMQRVGQRQWNLRPYALGLSYESPVSYSRMVFVLLMLATVTFDGFLETSSWLRLMNTAATVPGIEPLLYAFQERGVDTAQVLSTMALLCFPVLFLAAFMLTCLGTARMSRGIEQKHRPFGATQLARRFVLTLVPIAVAYHMAHYFSMLINSGQFVIPLASDPLGLGWNLLGTASYRVDLTLVGVRLVWYSTVVAIVAGHMLSVYLAHVEALRVFGNRDEARRRQLPMLALMVAYTMLGLWILAQPVVS